MMLAEDDAKTQLFYGAEKIGSGENPCGVAVGSALKSWFDDRHSP
jgi:hypothetical protein